MLLKLPSGSMILLTITWKWRILLSDDLRRDVGDLVINLSPLNILSNDVLAWKEIPKLTCCFCPLWVLMVFRNNVRRYQWHRKQKLV